MARVIWDRHEIKASGNLGGTDRVIIYDDGMVTDEHREPKSWIRSSVITSLARLLTDIEVDFHNECSDQVTGFLAQ